MTGIGPHITRSASRWNATDSTQDNGVGKTLSLRELQRAIALAGLETVNARPAFDS